MSTHIGAKKGDIAETVLISGDPLRAKFMAQEFLEEPQCYNQTRGMYGYTGIYKGKRISIQGTGMGIPSTAIYIHELIHEYGVKQLVRIGTCGSYQKHLHLRDLVIALAASTDSAQNKIAFAGMDFAPVANFGLVQEAYRHAVAKGLRVQVGGVLSTDTFYHHDPEAWRLWERHNVLAVEMETSCLYTLAAKHHVKALALLTVSDSFHAAESLTSEERESSLLAMTEVALDCVH